MNNVSGGGTLIVAGSMGAQETAVLPGGGSLVAIASKGAHGDVVGGGNGSVVVAVSKGGLGDPALSANGTAVLAGRAGARKPVLVHGGGTTAAQGWKGARVAAHLPGGGAVVITYSRMGGSIHYAYLPGGGEILAAGVRFYTDVAVRAPAKYAPVRLVYLYLDYCGNVFGTAPCLAMGTPCFNTWKTCKYLSAFDNVGKTYKYSEIDATLPFKGVRPYVKSVKLLPTEIKTNLTVNARVSVTMVDEMDQDIDTDPYLVGPGRI